MSDVIQMEAGQVLPHIHERVVDFTDLIPYYVHHEVTYSAIHQLVCHDSPEMYFEQAPEGYIEALANLFPDVAESMHRGEQMQLMDGDINVIPLNVDTPLRLIASWARDRLDDFVDDMNAGATYVSRTPGSNELHLRMVLH